MLMSPYIPAGSVFQEPKGPMATSQFDLTSMCSTAKNLFNLSGLRPGTLFCKHVGGAGGRGGRGPAEELFCTYAHTAPYSSYPDPLRGVLKKNRGLDTNRHTQDSSRGETRGPAPSTSCSRSTRPARTGASHPVPQFRPLVP